MRLSILAFYSMSVVFVPITIGCGGASEFRTAKAPCGLVASEVEAKKVVTKKLLRGLVAEPASAEFDTVYATAMYYLSEPSLIEKNSIYTAYIARNDLGANLLVIKWIGCGEEMPLYSLRDLNGGILGLGGGGQVAVNNITFLRSKMVEILSPGESPKTELPIVRINKLVDELVGIANDGSANNFVYISKKNWRSSVNNK